MRFKDWKKPMIRNNKPTKYNWVVQHTKKFEMGKYVDIGAYTYINAQHSVTLENNVQIGSHCSIYSISTIDGKKGRVLLKKNSCLGSHSIVMPGVTIGANSIIGAFSFVNRNIPPNSQAFGIHVKIIKKIKHTIK